MNHYETVFILNPVLSEEQTKETVLKYEKFLTSKGAKMVSKEDWGLKKLAYPIQNKKSGFCKFHGFVRILSFPTLRVKHPSFKNSRFLFLDLNK